MFYRDEPWLLLSVEERKLRRRQFLFVQGLFFAAGLLYLHFVGA